MMLRLPTQRYSLQTRLVSRVSARHVIKLSRNFNQKLRLAPLSAAPEGQSDQSKKSDKSKSGKKQEASAKSKSSDEIQSADKAQTQDEAQSLEKAQSEEKALSPKEESGGDDESRPMGVEPDAPKSEISTSVAPPTPEMSSDMEPSLDDYKAALFDSFYGVERGLRARSEVRAEINELISQLEAKNPSPTPTEEMSKLQGTWKLAYTSNSQATAVLALSKLPLVTIGDITQKIDTENFAVENQVTITVPFQRTTLGTTASFEVSSPKRLQLKLEKGKIQTPELTNDLELPDTVSVLGQSIDLSQLKAALSPVQEGVSGLIEGVNSVISGTPGLEIPAQNDAAQTWLLNTYLDDDTRIARSDGGSVFVFTKA